MPAGSGRYPSGQRGQTVNLLAYAFGGSNPPLPTILRGNSSAVERQPSKLGVAGSNPVSRSIVATGVSTARTEGGLFEMGVAPTGPTGRRGVVGPVDARSAVGARGVLDVRCVGSSRCAGWAGGARSTHSHDSAHVAQLAEHALGKGEVSGSIPDMGSTLSRIRR